MAADARGYDADVIALLVGMLLLVFFTTWTMMNSVGWAVLMLVVVLVGGAVLGSSANADID